MHGNKLIDQVFGNFWKAENMSLMKCFGDTLRILFYEIST